MVEVLRMIGKAIAAFALGAFALLSGKSRAAPSLPEPNEPTGSIAGREAVIDLGEGIGLSTAWVQWLVWVSKGESGWSTTAHNDTPGEVAASRKAYRRLVKEGRWECPQDEPAYAVGSGGWYGQLAPYTALFLGRYGHPLACDVRTAWESPGASTLAHLEHVRGLLPMLASIPENRRTFLTLRAIYGLPSRLHKPADIEAKRAAYTKTLKAAGLDPGLLDVRVPQLPPHVLASAASWSD